jgi:thioredoxin-like negative regulator of GroEL
MPTFVFFQHGKEVARLQGANKDPIEQTIKKFYKDTPTKDAGYVRRD